MSSKRGIRRRSCVGKVRYARQAAFAAAWHLNGRADHGRVHAYRCAWCGGWHVGHPPQTATVEER